MTKSHVWECYLVTKLIKLRTLFMNISIISVRNLQKIFATIALFTMVFSPFANVPFAEAAASANLDQGKNGGVGAAPISPVDWVNGNVNGNQGHYVEGQSVPYRMVMTGLNAGVPNTLVIAFDVKQSSKFAIDYITSDNRISETVSPCNGTGICTDGDLTPDNTFDIPAPAYTGVAGAVTPTTVANSFNAVDGICTMVFGRITAKKT